MSNQSIHLSVIVPVFNSESFIEKSLIVLDEFMRSLAYGAELIIVDDGSEDRSLEIAEKWALEKRPYHVQVTTVGSNKGKGAAVATGMLAAHGRFRVFLDVDLAYPPSQVLRIVQALEDGNDVAVACRVDPASRYTISPAFFHYLYTRHLASRIINWVLRRAIISHCRDSQAGLKGFTKESAEKIFSRLTVFGFPFDIEAMFLADKLGFRVREVAIEFRYFSEPTTVVFMQDGIGIGKSVLKIRLNHFLGRYKLPKKDGPKNLIINADDYGMTMPITNGILKTIQVGAVKSVSVMTNSPDFEKSMDELLKQQPHPEVGLHAVFTWGTPIVHPKDIPTLVDKNGKFLSRNKLLFKSLFGMISPSEVYKELHAQCKKLSKRWPNINRIDGHHHVHIFPVIRRAVECVAREFGIKFVRSPREGSWSPWHRAFLRRLLVAMFFSSSPSYWRGRGFATSDHFGGFSLGGGRGLKKRWLDTLAIIPNDTTEIMVHPGYFSENYDGYNKQREDEISALTDHEVIAKLARPEPVEGRSVHGSTSSP